MPKILNEVGTVNPKGGLIIPLKYRRKIGIKAETKLKLKLEENKLIYSVISDPIDFLCGLLPKDKNCLINSTLSKSN